MDRVPNTFSLPWLNCSIQKILNTVITLIQHGLSCFVWWSNCLVWRSELSYMTAQVPEYTVGVGQRHRLNCLVSTVSILGNDWKWQGDFTFAFGVILGQSERHILPELPVAWALGSIKRWHCRPCHRFSFNYFNISWLTMTNILLGSTRY